VPELLGRCAVCAAPYEGEHNQYNCPMKLFEYMGMKIPIVASDWGDIPNIVEHGRTALLHKEADPAALAEAIREVWRDPAAARARAEAAYALAQGRTWRATARRILDWRASRAGGAEK
jgi:glycosyltransferase involved in cell wall biosynthesis